MLRDSPLHNFLFETDPDGFYDGLSTFCTPWIDVCVLLHLVRRRRPGRFLEIGTHRGYTCRILAEKFPEMRITTVDPGDQVPEGDRPSNQFGEYLRQDEIGELVAGHRNVEVIRRRFEDIEWGQARFEMIFIDGNHTLNSVLADSRLALRLVTKPGVIAWHDVNNVKSVNDALEMIAVDHTIVTLHNTWIGYLDTH
jgi:predicted O-methyltransferase YrrM